MTKVDLGSRIPGLADWRKAFSEDPISISVASDTEANRESFFGYIKSLSQ